MSNATTEVSEADPAVTVGYGVAQPVLATKDVVILVNIPTLSHLTTSVNKSFGGFTVPGEDLLLVVFNVFNVMGGFKDLCYNQTVWAFSGHCENFTKLY